MQKCTASQWYVLISLYFQVLSSWHISSPVKTSLEKNNDNCGGNKVTRHGGKLLNDRRHSCAVNPGAKLTSSPSAQGETQKAPNKEGCLDLFFSELFITSEAVKNSSLMLQMERWKGGKRHLGREKAFQANCGSFWYIVYQHARCCVCRLCASRNSLLWAAVRKWTVSKLKTWSNLNPAFLLKVTWQKPQYFRMHFCYKVFLYLSKISKWTPRQSDSLVLFVLWDTKVWCIILHNFPHSHSGKPLKINEP